MPFFVLIIRWVESSDFGLKADDLGHRILKSDFIPLDFAKSDCISRPILFSDRKIEIRSSESDRIINGLTYGKKRHDRPDVGGVSITSWNGAPSRKVCVINGQMTKVSNE